MALGIMKKNNIIDLIGNTPLIKLNYPSKITGCEIYGKAEFLNQEDQLKIELLFQ